VETLVLSLSRPQTTDAVTRGAGRLMIALGYAPLLEVTLPNGRRADLMALGPRGQIAIAEVKSSLEFPREILPETPGLIVADGFGGAVLREAPVAPLVGARRKALTLAFARLAALRATLV